MPEVACIEADQTVSVQTIHGGAQRSGPHRPGRSCRWMAFTGTAKPRTGVHAIL